MSARSRSVSQGNPLRTCPSRTNAQRRAPARAFHDTSTSQRGPPAIDLTGYRHSATTRPTSPEESMDYLVELRRSQHAPQHVAVVRLVPLGPQDERLAQDGVVGPA